MALYHEIINHMTEDELRNYICVIQEADECRGSIVFAQSEMIDLLQRLYNTQDYKEFKLTEWQCKIGVIRKLEEQLKEKYSQFLPTPCCEMKGEKENGK